ncbi:pyridoxamine 5'-phosphate oxidase family protein [Weissella diestrammenae]|uniref:Pyridoxamine 5'-phosphate oxidase family protein n=1 Tax=Weissella diestrammenae TaxID=1162633 RepID=A0A7G9T5T5_9LACO|nr:pyridoxamine 5'-phosphate oxidase family protein [Weissella diestrammenae]MCM0582289.1 pyridoxamine 5'-phosphate oxidase family protein [Weissella diestrammenae]QNN75460.1 pyridoxamine 5'-phosphate oxidase family protein [Weissella diestrammenae]
MDNNNHAMMLKYLRESHVLNLATAVDNIPSNRDVFFFLPDDFSNVLYITSPASSKKVMDIQKNPNVSFMTVPTDHDNGVVTSNAATAKLSEKSMAEICPLIAKQIPEWEDTVGEAVADFIVIEIEFETAKIFGDQGIFDLELV